MLSAAAAFPASNPTVMNPWQDFRTGVMPCDVTEHYFSSIQSPNPVISTSSSDELNRNQANASSGSDEPNQPVSVIDERKQRRMISNRESARRSRMRKQRHLENLRNQVNRLRIENRELANQVRFVLYHSHSVRTDNDRLRAEHSVLWRKLSEIRQILLFKQLQQFPSSSSWPCNNVNMIFAEQTPSLIA